MKKSNLKILLCNIAIRPNPDPFPPLACTSLCNYLKDAGYAPEFYDIDALRPSWDELYGYFEKERFDIVGISAVVSTGYSYVKRLSKTIKEASPTTQIVLGGNLAAAYDIILRKCRVDICVIGEGEKVLLNLVRHLGQFGNFHAGPTLDLIKGVAFIDTDGKTVCTGPQELLSSAEIEEPDYDLLDRCSKINQYIIEPSSRFDFLYDSRTFEAHRKGKKMATIFTSKGCINKCSFCHRWIKGYRIIPLEKVISTIKHLKDKYNVGFLSISDECFGEDKGWLEEFIKLIKPLDMLFEVAGARVFIIKNDPTVMHRLKESGLTAIYFGMESGSDKILKIMDKNATSKENLEVARVCQDAGIFTVIQLVVGMPGENEETINQTIQFLKEATGNLPYVPLLSVNYLQALPGTPCYDYLRLRGFLGKTIEEEEKYLLRVSDVDAAEFKQYINVSEEPLSKVKSWQRKIHISTRIHWLKQHNWKVNKMPSGLLGMKVFSWYHLILYRIIDLLGDLFWKVIIFYNRFALYGLKGGLMISLWLTQGDRSKFKIQADALRIITGLKVKEEVDFKKQAEIGSDNLLRKNLSRR